MLTLIPIVAMSLLQISSFQTTDVFALKSGDRVLFYGDSITDQRLYTTYVEVFVRTRYPEQRVDFFARGVGGDATWGGWMGDLHTRMTRDAKPCKATVITVMLGMNDGGYVPFQQNIYETYQEWYGKLLAELRTISPGARITLIGSSPFDDVTRKNAQFGGYNEVVMKFGAYVQDLAKKENLQYVDFNAPLVEMMKRAKKIDQTLAESVIPDFIHPGPSGHLGMASELLKAWKADGTVSEVRLDANAKSVVSQRRTEISGFDGQRWTQIDQALPFPTNDSMSAALRTSDFSASLNRQFLAVSGLEAGEYELLIDGKQVGKFESSDLEQGVNLSERATPMREQAQKVFELTEKRVNADHMRWQQVGVLLAGLKHTKSAMTELEKLDQELDEQLRKIARPKTHQFELRKASGKEAR